MITIIKKIISFVLIFVFITTNCIFASDTVVTTNTDLSILNVRCILFDDNTSIEEYAIYGAKYENYVVKAKEIKAYRIIGLDEKNITFGIDKEVTFYYSRSGDGVKYNKHEKYANGYPDNTFRPDNELTWSEALTMLYNIKDVKKNNINSGTYSNWYTEAFDYFKQNNYLDFKLSENNNNLDPNEPITKKEFTSIAMNYTGNYIEDSLLNAFLQIDNLSRTNNITRAESVWVINKLLERNNNILTMPTINLKFSDVDQSNIFYGAILEACYTHEYILEGENNEKWLSAY